MGAQRIAGGWSDWLDPLISKRTRRTSNSFTIKLPLASDTVNEVVLTNGRTVGDMIKVNFAAADNFNQTGIALNAAVQLPVFNLEASAVAAGVRRSSTRGAISFSSAISASFDIQDALKV